MCYTAHPNDELTLLLCDIATFVAQQSNNTICALQVLMPTLSIDSLDEDKYPPLNKQDLRTVLKTHIVGEKGNYLVPIKIFSELIEKPQKEWYNPYFDYQTHGDNFACLSIRDVEQLSNHSSYCKAIIDAQEQYRLFLQEQGGLLSQLRQLVAQLSFNSTEGIGNETNAGGGVYSAIIHFHEYYSQLDNVSKERIPDKVKEQIELLLELPMNAGVNIDATQNLNTCIATRRTKLDKAINELSAIGLNDEIKANLIIKKKEHLTYCQAELQQALKIGSYKGYERLPLNLELLREFHVDFHISDLDNLKIMMKLAPQELASIFQDARVQSEISVLSFLS